MWLRDDKRFYLCYPLSLLVPFFFAFPACQSCHGGRCRRQRRDRRYGGMLQVILGLGLVLAAIAGCAWLLRRFGGLQANGAGAIKVIGGSAVGQRERVVLVEVADTWLVIGVAPGHVTALHSMPKGDIANEGNSDARDARQGFPRWLRQVKEKRDAQQHSE